MRILSIFLTNEETELPDNAQARFNNHLDI